MSIMTAAEALALLDVSEQLETAIGRTYGEHPTMEHFVRVRGASFSVAADVCGTDALPSEEMARLFAAAPALRRTVIAQAAEIERLTALAAAHSDRIGDLCDEASLMRDEIEGATATIERQSANASIATEEINRLRAEVAAWRDRPDGAQTQHALDVATAERDATIAQLAESSRENRAAWRELSTAVREFFAAEKRHDSVVMAWLNTDEMDRDADAAKDASAASLAAARIALAARVGCER